MSAHTSEVVVAFAKTLLGTDACGFPGCPPWFCQNHDPLFWDIARKDIEQLRPMLEHCLRQFDWPFDYIAAEFGVSVALVEAVY